MGQWPDIFQHEKLSYVCVLFACCLTSIILLDLNSFASDQEVLGETVFFICNCSIPLRETTAMEMALLVVVVVVVVVGFIIFCLCVFVDFSLQVRLTPTASHDL